jgi:fumarylacetoacetase
MTLINETHNPALKSWLASANIAGCDFPIQNLPFAVFRRKGAGEAFRGGVAIGDQILDLAAVAKSGFLKGEAAAAAQAGAQDKLNALMALGSEAWSALRLALSRALREGESLTNPVEQTALQALSLIHI